MDNKINRFVTVFAYRLCFLDSKVKPDKSGLRKYFQLNSVYLDLQPVCHIVCTDTRIHPAIYTGLQKHAPYSPCTMTIPCLKYQPRVLGVPGAA